MKKWYKQPYFDRRNWILENYNKLNLSSDEVLLLLIIDFARDCKKVISYEYLMDKLSCDHKKIDSIISSLVLKKYLSINPTSKGVSFDIDAIFEFDPDKYEISDNKDIFNCFEQLVNRPLSASELQKLSDLLNDYSTNEIIDAIRTAEAYRKTSISYIEAVLRNEKK